LVQWRARHTPWENARSMSSTRSTKNRYTNIKTQIFFRACCMFHIYPYGFCNPVQIHGMKIKDMIWYDTFMSERGWYYSLHKINRMFILCIWFLRQSYEVPSKQAYKEPGSWFKSYVRYRLEHCNKYTLVPVKCLKFYNK